MNCSVDGRSEAGSLLDWHWRHSGWGVIRTGQTEQKKFNRWAPIRRGSAVEPIAGRYAAEGRTYEQPSLSLSHRGGNPRGEPCGSRISPPCPGTGGVT